MYSKIINSEAMMSLYYWQFNLCALCVTLLIILEVAKRKDLKQEKNKWFLLIGLAIILASLADLPGIYMLNAPERFNYVVADLSMMVFLILRNMMPFLYACYLGSILKLRLRVKKWVLGVMVLPEAVMLVWMLIEPSRRLVYYYQGTEYVGGPLVDIFYVFTAYYVVLGMAMVLYYRKALKRKEKFAYYAFSILSLAPVAVQVFYPQLKWALFFQAIGLLGASLTIDNEEAVRSPVTGFYNRYALLHDAGQIFAMGLDADVILIKIPSIQSLAVAIGGETVEQINCDIGNHLLKQIPSRWTMYQYGPERYAIVAYRPREGQTDAFVKLLKNRFVEPWEYGNGSIQLSSEILVCRLPEKLANVEQLTMVMDAPFEPLQAGAQVVYIDEPANQQYEAKVEMALRGAIKDKKLLVYYQPIQDTSLNRIHTAEALVRLNDPELGMVSPEYFIPLAEKHGLMRDLGDFVFENVCKFLDEHRDTGLSYVEVNLSAVQAVDGMLPDRWDRIMKKYAVRPEQFCLEITESALATSRFTMEKVIEDLKSRGFSFALDDYGTGYANNAYVMEFPFDLIKIDKSILWGADSNEKTNKLLHHSIMMFHDLEMKVVVEGVETPEHREKLEKAGVEFLQGYLFSKPLPDDAALKLFESQNAVAG